MRTIIPNLLWTANARQVRDIRAVLLDGVTAIVDVAMEEPPIAFPRDIVYCRFPLLDGACNATEVLQAALETTMTFVRAGRPTVVACSGGMSRSPAIAAAVVTQLEQVTLPEAVARIARDGPCDIAPGLLVALQAYLRKH